MHTKLLNLGFIKQGTQYICEDIVIEVRPDNMVYLVALGQEVTYDELERLLLLA